MGTKMLCLIVEIVQYLKPLPPLLYKSTFSLYTILFLLTSQKSIFLHYYILHTIVLVLPTTHYTPHFLYTYFLLLYFYFQLLHYCIFFVFVLHTFCIIFFLCLL